MSEEMVGQKDAYFRGYRDGLEESRGHVAIVEKYMFNNFKPSDSVKLVLNMIKNFLDESIESKKL